MLPWLLLAALVSNAAADDVESLRPQVQVDGGLSVIGPGYEHPLARRIAVQVEAFVFGTYFLPWFDAGDEVRGFGAGIRPTWFMRASGRGLYVAPYVRVVAVDGESITAAEGIGFTTGAFVGWAFGLGERVDLRVGAGVQYIRFGAGTEPDRVSASTPFIALDFVLGYRL